MCALARNESHGQDWYVFCRVVRMGSERKFSRICRENLRAKFGSCGGSVSLFLETSNKKFSRVFGRKQVVLGKLLQSIGVFAVPGLSWICLQEIRSNGCKLLILRLFQELRVVFVETSVNAEENPSAVPKTPEKTVTIQLIRRFKDSRFETAVLLYI